MAQISAVWSKLHEAIYIGGGSRGFVDAGGLR